LLAKMVTAHKNKGVTLIELMIVVVIIAILTAIAYPSYQEYITKARRVDAQGVLMEAAQFMERHHTANYRYHQDLAGAAVALPNNLLESPKDPGIKYYDMAIQTVTASAYTLVASPKGPQAGDGILMITNQGLKGWDRNNNGSIDVDEDCWNKMCS